MKHQWEHVRGKGKFDDMGNYGRRRCKLCHKEQTKQSQQEWGRVVGYHWYPLVGRCKGKPDESTTAV